VKANSRMDTIQRMKRNKEVQKVNPGARERQAVRVSYKTPAVLLIVKSSQSIVSHRGKKQIYVKSDCHLRN
jgi:Tfp pilus assembly protein PilV